jgi:hypothetical protein
MAQHTPGKKRRQPDMKKEPDSSGKYKSSTLRISTVVNKIILSEFSGDLFIKTKKQKQPGDGEMKEVAKLAVKNGNKATQGLYLIHWIKKLLSFNIVINIHRQNP